VVFCVDEKTAIQALDRKDRMLPLSPGRAESHGFEYKRNGTLSLFAALNTATGQVIGKTASRHTSEQSVAFLTDVIASQRPKQEMALLKKQWGVPRTRASTDRCLRCFTKDEGRPFGVGLQEQAPNRHKLRG
jgi:hypothetical protein